MTSEAKTHMLPTAHENLHRDLQKFIPAARLISDPLRTLVYGTDASLYRLIPKLVVRVESEDEMRRILALAHQHGTPVTFRAAGTSLSGQAITDSVLLQLGDGWRNWRIGEEAATISLQPGVIGGHANRYLAPHQRKIGPDPASIKTPPRSTPVLSAASPPTTPAACVAAPPRTATRPCTACG